MALLKQSNHFYSDIKIEIDSIPSSFRYFNEDNKIDNTHKDKKVIDFSVEVEDSDHNENENRNPLNEHRYTENETLMMILFMKLHQVRAVLSEVSLTKNVSICHSQIYLVREGLDITIHETLISICLGILIKDF